MEREIARQNLEKNALEAINLARIYIPSCGLPSYTCTLNFTNTEKIPVEEVSTKNTPLATFYKFLEPYVRKLAEKTLTQKRFKIEKKA